MDNEDNSEIIDSVETTFRIIEALSEIQPGGVSEIADETEIPVSTTYVHLNSLLHLGYVVKINNHYQLSLRFLEHGGTVRGKTAMSRSVQKEVNRLAYTANEVVGFATEERGKRVILYRSEGSGAISDRIIVGESTYLHWTSLGKAILAHLPQERIGEIIDQHGLPQGTKSTITDRSDLMDELASIREFGYALDNAERRRGIRGIAVPIKKADERVVGSIGIAGPKTRLNDKYLTDLLKLLLETKNIIEINKGFYD